MVSVPKKSGPLTDIVGNPVLQPDKENSLSLFNMFKLYISSK